MNDSKIILTIGIPTYNQPEAIKKTLHSLKNQANADDIEILILDDSETNETEEFVKKNKFKNLRYVRGKKIHLDYADFWLMKNARGKYIWWFGDDYFYPRALEKVRKIIQLNPDFVWINSNSQDNVVTKSIGDSRWMSPNQMMFQIGDLLTFLSSLLWKRKTYLTQIKLGEKHIGTCMAYMYPQIELFAKEIKCYYCSEPLFQSDKRDFKKLWYNPFEVFTKNYFNMLEYFYSKENLKKVLKMEKKRRGFQILKGVLFYKLKGYDYGLGKANFKDIMSTFWKWPFFLGLFSNDYFNIFIVFFS